MLGVGFASSPRSGWCPCAPAARAWTNACGLTENPCLSLLHKLGAASCRTEPGPRLEQFTCQTPAGADRGVGPSAPSPPARAVAPSPRGSEAELPAVRDAPVGTILLAPTVSEMGTRAHVQQDAALSFLSPSLHRNVYRPSGGCEPTGHMASRARWHGARLWRWPRWCRCPVE